MKEKLKYLINYYEEWFRCLVFMVCLLIIAVPLIIYASRHITKETHFEKGIVLDRGDAMELIKLHGKIDSRIQTQTDSDRVIKKLYGLLRDNRHEVYRQDGVSYEVITVKDIEKVLEVTE